MKTQMGGIDSADGLLKLSDHTLQPIYAEIEEIPKCSHTFSSLFTSSATLKLKCEKI